jgi:CxxC-x17-CxxC domain-containing protein
MMSFHRDSRSGGRDNNRFGRNDFGKRSFGGRDSGRPQMHQATCSDCGNACEVPFRPTGDRPVFCNSCFKKGGAPNKGYESRFEPRNEPRFESRKEPRSEQRNDSNKEQFDALNAKLDRIVKILTTLASKETSIEPEMAKEESEVAPKPKRKKKEKKVDAE